MTTYIGLAIADGMFPSTCTISRRELNADQVKEIIMAGIVTCCNPSHQTTLKALDQKFGIVVPFRIAPVMVSLKSNDSIIVLSARFPRRLAEGETWTQADVDAAEFKFGEWLVI
jgi:hypothetical protein